MGKNEEGVWPGAPWANEPVGELVILIRVSRPDK